MNDYATHQPVLREMLNRTTGSILELGSGDYSTPLIHELTEGRKVLTVDDSLEWLNKYIGLQTENHKFICVEDRRFQEFYDNDDEQWNVVFIDNGAWSARVKAIIKYKDVADYIILHDCDYMAGHGLLGITGSGSHRNYSSVFRYWNEYLIKNSTPWNPPTLLASNKMSVRDIIIEGMVIINVSKS